MENKSSNVEIQLQLIKVLETGFFIDTARLNSIKTKTQDLFKIEIGLQILPDLISETLDVQLIVRYMLSEEKEDIKVAELQSSNIFKIFNLSKVITITDENLTDSNNLIPTLVGIALGTIRGILVVKAAGTVLSDYPIPVVNPVELCKGINKRI